MSFWLLSAPVVPPDRAVVEPDLDPLVNRVTRYAVPVALYRTVMLLIPDNPGLLIEQAALVVPELGFLFLAVSIINVRLRLRGASPDEAEAEEDKCQV